MNTNISTNIGADISTDIGRRHDTLAAVVLAALVGLAGLGALLDGALTSTGRTVLAGLGLAVLGAVVGLGRWTVRRVRERREDAADALAGAAWRTQHLPHLAAHGDRDRAEVA